MIPPVTSLIPLLERTEVFGYLTAAIKPLLVLLLALTPICAAFVPDGKLKADDYTVPMAARTLR